MPITPRGLCECPCHTSDDRIMHMVPCCAGDAGGRQAREIAQAPAMYELLKELEFVGGTFGGECPLCDEQPHKADCRLAAVLKAVEGEA